MSENKRNRKSNQNKELKRPIILAKKCDKDEKLVVDKPRILLKPKDKEHSESAQASSSSSSTQISIAARPIEPSSSNSDAIKVNRLQPVHHASASSRDSKDSHASAHTSSNETSTPTTAASEPKLPTMKHPISIISDHYQIQNHVQDYLIETNTDFMVIGVIGTQGAGKSFIMNMLIDDVTNFDDVEHINRLVGRRSGVFEMRNHSGDTLSNMPVTEGIEMYVTRHRTILLDCSPILCNPYKKEAIFNELDDLKMVIFLLSVCNTLIVVEDCGFNIHLMRLLMMADSMKVDVFETDLNEQRYSPNILIFKNKCRNCDFTVEAKQRTSNLYRAFFVCSGLKMVSGAAGRNLERKANGSNDDVPDVFYFPWIDSNAKHHYQPHPDVEILMAEFRQRVFMAPRQSFPLPNQQATACTEKNWFHLALAVWDAHKTSYFLRKYETLKEKEWALRV